MGVTKPKLQLFPTYFIAVCKLHYIPLTETKWVVDVEGKNYIQTKDKVRGGIKLWNDVTTKSYFSHITLPQSKRTNLKCWFTIVFRSCFELIIWNSTRHITHKISNMALMPNLICLIKIWETKIKCKCLILFLHCYHLNWWNWYKFSFDLVWHKDWNSWISITNLIDVLIGLWFLDKL